MTLRELLDRTSLKAIGRNIGLDVQVIEGHIQCTPLDPDDPRYSADYLFPSMKMVETCRADDHPFFQPFIEAGMLTVEQMHHAAARYYLGKTTSGHPIYWMIDETLAPLDAHIANGTWMSTLLKAREPLLQLWRPTHCLFGLHLLRTSRQLIAIVESEASAALLSELFPEYLWMAYATEAHLCIDLFSPLEGCSVILYPRTDPYMSNYLFMHELSVSVSQQLNIDITVATILEDHATEEQRERCIDLVDFLIEAQYSV